jgi:hypothetical protein
MDTNDHKWVLSDFADWHGHRLLIHFKLFGLFVFIGVICGRFIGERG